MDKREIIRPTVLEIDIGNFKHNIEQIKKRLKPETKIMPVIKANAYGTYLNTRLDLINEFDIVAVAIVDEGVELRKLGYQKDIFVLNQPATSEINKIIEYDLVIGLSSPYFLKEVKKQNRQIRVHIEIETGMGRTGINMEQLEQFIEDMKNVKTEGIYTHLSSDDIDEEYTRKQLEIFEKAINIIENKEKDIKYIHASASNGIINYPEAHYNLVRPGIILYGYESGEGIKEKISLKPVCTLKSKITFLKTVKEGTSISYERKFITKRESKIATIPMGYADGLKRNLSNKGHVVIKGKKVPIIGNICMDGFMVDVTDLDEVEIGDKVYIWDNDQITLEEIASKCGTINYEILSTISERVPRKFIN